MKALPKKEHEAAKETVAYEAVKRIGAIYHLDNQLADLKPDERRKQRQVTSNLWWWLSLRGQKRSENPAV